MSFVFDLTNFVANVVDTYQKNELTLVLSNFEGYRIAEKTTFDETFGIYWLDDGTACINCNEVDIATFSSVPFTTIENIIDGVVYPSTDEKMRFVNVEQSLKLLMCTRKSVTLDVVHSGGIVIPVSGLKCCWKFGVLKSIGN